MSFFSRLVPPSRKGENNFKRARAAELRRDFDKAQAYFSAAAGAFDDHFARLKDKGKAPRASHLAMAGICYTKLGRNEDAITILEQCLAIKDVPDAYLHAGYAAAKLGDADRAVDYWDRYPQWAEQRIVAKALKEQVQALREEKISLQAACEAVAHAVHQQDKHNAGVRLMRRGKKEYPPHRGY
ncbi:tetratricopeptide repeat protein [Pseudodesulfovibrio cashew]|uniref:Tetratricopeptide repeat protein n=1 Tax=Pseudodesulfovibrio cashew TaxID=2678688 RepID=A0A6I6JCU6_9BACT|nr:tetratricopeptide repeat protein [Pseudodesulfovibrio cashew]QGY38969.1 tetratricopeptide repeat protein [Pseudodesulfovibrio cashew]